MSATGVPAGAGVPVATDVAAGAPAPARARIARESVHDHTGTTVGYELLFQPGPELGVLSQSTSDAMTASLISTAFGEFGLDRLGTRRNLYVGMPRPLLTGELPLPFGPHNVVLEVLHPLEVDDELFEGLQQLKYQGFRLAIDATLSGSRHAELLPLIDLVKVDIWAVDNADLAELATYIRTLTPKARLLADGVRDGAAWQECLAAGFDLFQGNHFEHPVPGRARRGEVSTSQAISLQLLAALSVPDTTIAEVERIVSADPGLSVRVLGAVNSASGAGRSVGSIRQAIVLLGRRALSGWVMLAALGGHQSSHREDMVGVLTRARVCELLSEYLLDVDAASAYSAGLLFGLSDVLGVEPGVVARAARVDDELSAALTDRMGPIGQLLEAVALFERTGSAGGELPAAQLARAHLHALGGAVSTVDDLLGAPPE